MINSKCKICRRLGQKLFLKGERCLSPKCAMIRKPYQPGPKKKRRRRRTTATDYAKELREKQKLKSWYGLSESQFGRYVREILAKQGKTQNPAEELIKKLEKRLDNIVFRLGFAKSRQQARQLVSHNHFLVNQKSINIPSYQVEKEDVVSIKEGKKKKAVFQDLAAILKKKEVPAWLKLEKDKLEGKVSAEPSLKEAVPPAEISIIFEFYSR